MSRGFGLTVAYRLEIGLVFSHIDTQKLISN